MPISTARQFFDDLVAGGTPAIEALVTSKKHENEWLDFKASSGDKEDKSTWSEAICGFGNNQGGVLIWGIDARKDSDGVDAASDLVPVANAAGHRSRLLELLRGAVEPPLLGVRIEAFYKTGDSGPGYVVCFIPESDTKPHRAELLKGKPYMIRISDAFINPSPSLLRTMFFPKSGPTLEVEVRPEWTPPEAILLNGRQEIEVRFEVTMQNTGISSAKNLYIKIEADPHTATVDTPWPRSKYEDQFRTGIEYPRLVYPSSTAFLCRVRHRAGVFREQGSGKPTVIPAVERFEIKLDVYAEDMIPLKLIAVLGEYEVRFGHSMTAKHRD